VDEPEPLDEHAAAEAVRISSEAASRRREGDRSMGAAYARTGGRWDPSAEKVHRYKSIF
jgi:hypothetical protein